MPEFTVTWKIDVTADTPRNAARMARLMQDDDSTATVFEVAGAFGAEPVVVDLSTEEPDERLVPDFLLDFAGEYGGNAYPEQVALRMTITPEDDVFQMRVETTDGSVLFGYRIDEDEAHGIMEVAMRDHSIDDDSYEEHLPDGISRTVTWNLDDGDYAIRLNEDQISEVGDWLRYATGEETWDWAEQGEEWTA